MIGTTVKMYQMFSSKYKLTYGEMDDTFFHILDGPARLFFINNL